MTDDEEYTWNTSLSTYDAESVEVRGRDLPGAIMGEMDFGETVFLLLTGDQPDSGERRMTNAILSSLMVHGVTPHAIAARMTYMAAPESIQGAVASGILGAGDRFVGAMEGCAAAIGRVTEGEVTPEELVAEYRERGAPFPGIGHPVHDPVDPRAQRLFDLAVEEEIAGNHVDALHDVQTEFEERAGVTLPINVTGAIAAVAADMGFSPSAARGLAIVSRTAGLVAEVLEEQHDPVARDTWEHVESHVHYRPPGADES